MVVDADGAAQLFGGVLYLAEAIGNRTIEIDAGIPDADEGGVPFDYRLDMDAFILCAADGSVQEVPQDIRQHIFVGANS